MKMIHLKKVEIKSIEVLQDVTMQFVNEYNSKLKSSLASNQNKYLNDVLLIDIATRLFYFFRQKFEKKTKETNLSFTPSESIVLMQICNEYYSYTNTDDAFYPHTLRKVKEEIFKQIIDLL